MQKWILRMHKRCIRKQINDIQDDPEFRFWQNRLEKKVPQRQDDNPKEDE